MKRAGCAICGRSLSPGRGRRRYCRLHRQDRRYVAPTVRQRGLPTPPRTVAPSGTLRREIARLGATPAMVIEAARRCGVEL